jgi:hypothetical protein
LLGWLAIFIATGSIGTTFVRDAWWDSEDIPVLADGIRSGHGYEGTDEYQPLGCDRYQLPGQPSESAESSDTPSPSLNDSLEKQAPRIAKVDQESGALTPVNSKDVRIDRWTAEKKPFISTVSLPVELAPKLINYPAWEIEVDKTRVRGDSLPETAQLSIRVPAGQHSVDVHFRRTWDRTAGASISIFSCFSLLGFAVFMRRKTSSAA